MAEIKITDLVSAEAIEQLKSANTEIQNLLTTYTQTAKDIAKGLEINVKVVGDLDKLEKFMVEKTREAASITGSLNTALERKNQILADTTNVTSRNLMEQERLNKAQRDAYTKHDKVRELLEKVNGSYENRIKRLNETTDAITSNKQAQKELKDSFDKGLITEDKYTARRLELVKAERSLKQEKADLNTHLKNEEREMQSVQGTYRNMSQQLELMKKAYKDLTEEEINSPLGKELETSIQNLDAHLKDMAADMGEFQRNVGNYAIAGQNGVVTTDSLIAVMNQQAVTMQDVADQTRILEEGKRMLDTTDEHYAETLAAINSQIDENKTKLTDVSDIMDKEASSAAEAEAQNKRLQEAMKHIDVTSEGAQKKIDELNEKIEKNNSVIEKATPTTERLKKEQKELEQAAKKAEEEEKKLNKELEEQKKTSEGLAGQMLSLIGVNANFANSLTSIKTEGNVIDGLNLKVKSLGKTLLGLLANPWVLAFLGIGGVALGVKWLWDYNKGLEEASRLTENFTGAAGKAADKVTASMQTLGDKMGKGFDETINSANVMVQQFGLSWEEAYDIMQRGIQAGADMSGNMLANIDRFAPALRDAGVSAEEFMAILSETRNGIFTEEGIQDIMKAGTRLKAMTKQTEEALDKVGISAQKMQEDLRDGNISMLEAVQQVSAKLKELPENSQEAGQIMKTVFGRTAAEGGTLLIQSIADVNTNLDECIDNMGELGKVNKEQMEAQRELNETLMSVFKMSGTSFEQMTTRAKTFVAKGIVSIIKGLVDIVNWFIRIYNKSIVVRGAVNSIVSVFKMLWDVAKFIMKQIVDSFKSMATMIEGVVTLDWELVKKGWADGMKALGGNLTNVAKGLANDFSSAFNNTVKGNLEEVTIGYGSYDTPGAASNHNGVTGPVNGLPTTKEKEKEAKEAEKAAKKKEKEAEKAQKEADKRAKEELKLLQELEESKLALMAESHEKDILQIRLKFKKKLDTIKGNGQREMALRLSIAEQCEMEVSQCEIKYREELSKINLENALAAVKKGSREELDLKLTQLEKSRRAEIKAAERTGADVSLIEEKFALQIQALREEYAAEKIHLMETQYANEQSLRDNEMTAEICRQKQCYLEKAKMAKGNAEKIEAIEREHQKMVAEIEEKYAEDSARAAIELINKALCEENLSSEERLRLEHELMRAKMEMETIMADHAINQSKRITEGEQDEMDRRKEAISSWLNIASEALNAVGDLSTSVFERKIEQIEAEQDANSEAGEKELSRITELVEKKVITEEEGEARTRAAEALTARKNEELERKKAQLKLREARWDKMNSLAQAGIATALAITQALPNVVLAAIAGAMGALQVATILATPIPQYRNGIDYHKGGPAIVGDGGEHEVILFKGAAWLTPDTPTLMDIPAGASVIPKADDILMERIMSSSITGKEKNPTVIINNDYSQLESGIREVSAIIKQQTKTQCRLASVRNYEIFKRGI